MSTGRSRKCVVIKRNFKRLKEPEDLHSWAKHVEDRETRTDRREEI